MHPLTRFAARSLLGLALGAGALAAHAAADDAMAPNDKELNQLYWQGHEALKKSDWDAALKRFAELERRLRAKEPASADAAIYWQAYALAQAKRSAEAKASVERLHHDFPQSRWSKDADTLLRQAQAAPALASGANAGASGDEDIAEIAVEGLLNAPPERAVPLLKKVLQSQHSIKVKKRALFVLSQIAQANAIDSVVEVARSGDPELREEAIRMLGVSGDARAIERLRELYAGSGSAAEKRTIVQAWLTADRKDLILAAARNETDAGVRHEAIQALGALDATAELRQLLDGTHDDASQRAIIQALGVAGDVKSLGAIALGDQAEQIRAEAIRAIGVAGGRDTLVGIYSKVSTPPLRKAVIEGLIVAGDSAGLLQLYHVAPTKEEKRELLRAISVQGDDTALSLIEQELDKPAASGDAPDKNPSRKK